MAHYLVLPSYVLPSFVLPIICPTNHLSYCYCLSYRRRNQSFVLLLIFVLPIIDICWCLIIYQIWFKNLPIFFDRSQYYCFVERCMARCWRFQQQTTEWKLGMVHGTRTNKAQPACGPSLMGSRGRMAWQDRSGWMVFNRVLVG